MIKALTVENFQAHKKTKLEFVEGINVIFGPSHSGKSSSVRIFKAVLQRSDFYLRTGENTGVSEVEFDNCSLKREYSSTQLRKCPNCKEKIDDTIQQCKCGEVISQKMSSDKFTLTEGLEAKEYQSFGLTLPEEILTKTKIRTLKFIDIDENFNIANQFDDLFFVAKSYGGLVRNKIISSLIPDSDKVDSLIKKLSSENMSKNSELDYLDKQTTKFETQLREVTPLLLKASELEKEIEDLQTRQANIKESLIDLDCILQSLAKLNKKLVVESKLDQIRKYLKSMEVKHLAMSEKMIQSNSLYSLSQKLKKLQKYEGIKLETFEVTIPENIKETKDKIISLNNLSSKITEEKRKEEKCNENLTSLYNQISDFKLKMEKLFEGKTLCPITGLEYCKSCKEIILKV